MSSTFVKMDAAVEGITTILTSDKEPVPPSLRRTLSADMSSRKWMAANGLKSKDVISTSQGSGVDIWKSIQQENMKKEEDLHAPPPGDVWTSILAKKSDGGPDAPPYVHPLVKRSGSSLSKLSLEVCTESLGSETGSDGFSSYQSSETGDVEDDAKEEEPVVTSAYRRRDPLCRARSFPPPLPSISKENGKSLYVRPHRDDGRLVLEAVSVTEQSNFRAHRQDGRLVLTFMEDPPTDELLEEEDDGLVTFCDDNVITKPEPDHEPEPECESESEPEEEEYEEEEEKLRSKLSVLINKPAVLSNRNPTWSNKFSEVVLFGEEEKEVVQSIPGLARVAPVSPYNVYEYFWRAKPTAIISPAPNHNQTLIIKNFNNKYIVSKEPESNREEVVVVRGNRTEYIVPLMRSCKERRSLLFWENHCIATS